MARRITLVPAREIGQCKQPRLFPKPVQQKLLDFDFGARVFELLLDGRGFFLVDALFDGLRSAVDEVLGFFQAEARDFANRLDDVDLVAADVGENDREFRLLFRRCRAAAAPPPPATTVAAAAETPKVSSIFFTRSDASSSVSPLISSRIVSTFAMTFASPLKIKNKFTGPLQGLLLVQEPARNC